jgi:glycosyltransferase involved in cell wall biosynthesis
VVRVRGLRRSADRSNPLEMLSFLLAALIPAFRLARRRRFDASIAFFTIPSGPISWMLRSRSVFRIWCRCAAATSRLRPEIDAIHRWIAPLRRAVLRRASAVVANSDSSARLSEPPTVRGAGHPERRRSARVRAGRCRRARRAEDAFRILFVGRLHSQKNVGALLESAAALAALPGPPVVVEIVGDGPERPALAKLAEQDRAARVLRWHGWLDKRRVLACYRRAHVFVNPSRYEGMPNGARGDGVRSRWSRAASAGTRIWWSRRDGLPLRPQRPDR